MTLENPYRPYTTEEVKGCKEWANNICLKVEDVCNGNNAYEGLVDAVRQYRDEIFLFEKCPDIESSRKLHDLQLELTFILKHDLKLSLE